MSTIFQTFFNYFLFFLIFVQNAQILRNAKATTDVAVANAEESMENWGGAIIGFILQKL